MLVSRKIPYERAACLAIKGKKNKQYVNANVSCRGAKERRRKLEKQHCFSFWKQLESHGGRPAVAKHILWLWAPFYPERNGSVLHQNIPMESSVF